MFEGRPDLDQLREAASAQELAGVSVRVRWTVADEDRHEVDRGAIERAPSGAADVQLEGRIVPVVCTRAPGISQLVSLAEKVRAWATATDVHAPPLLECLERVTTTEPEDIVAAALAIPDAGARAQGGLDPAGRVRDWTSSRRPETAPEQRSKGAQAASLPTTPIAPPSGAGGMPCNHSHQAPGLPGIRDGLGLDELTSI
ncbi:MAG: hypothetical protein IPG83_01915 [Novosphingobium sp.]|nr:hypothetical protein [Novosphingobium sp.]